MQALQLQVLQQWAQKHNRVVYAALLDISKAFDSVSHLGLLLKLLRVGVPPPMAKLISMLLANHVNHIDRETNVEISRGAPQGSVLGPFGFLMFFDLGKCLDEVKGIEAIASPFSMPQRTNMWADDTVVMANSIEELQKLLDAAYDWGKTWSMEFNAKKSVAIALGRRNCGGRLAVPPIAVTIGKDAIPWANEVTHLGVPLRARYSESRPKRFSEAKEKRITGKIDELSMLLRRHYGLNATVSLKMVETVILPMILYGCEVVDLPESAQVHLNRCLRLVLGAYDRSHRYELHYFCGQWRVQAIVEQRRLVAVARWLVWKKGGEELAKTLKFAEEEDLPWWRKLNETIERLQLTWEWRQLRLSSNPPETVKMRPTKAELRAKVEMWKLKVKERLDAEEAKWQQESLNGGFKEAIPLKCRKHPALWTKDANFAFMMMADHYDPINVVEENGGKARRCYRCGKEDGDRASHMLLECMEKEVKELRKMNTVVLRMCERRNFLRLWTDESEKTPKGVALEGMKSLLKTNPKKMEMLMAYMKSIYGLRKRARRESLRYERETLPSIVRNTIH